MLIASSSHGYKLPASEADLYDFVNHSNTIDHLANAIAGKRFRDQVHMATSGKIDIWLPKSMLYFTELQLMSD